MEHGITMILVLKQSLITLQYKYENIFKLTSTNISLIYSCWVTNNYLFRVLELQRHSLQGQLDLTTLNEEVMTPLQATSVRLQDSEKVSTYHLT